MKTPNLILCGGAAVLLSACIPSIKPFYTEPDVVTDARLLGTWQAQEDADGPQAWSFEGGGNEDYKLTVTEKEGKVGQFTARLFKLKQELFLDLVPYDCEYAPDQAELVAVSMFPGHLLVRVWQIEPELKLAFFDFDWLGKHLEENPEALAHHQEDKRLLLTAQTPELQRFVLKHLEDLFEEPDTLVRQPPEPATTSPGRSVGSGSAGSRFGLEPGSVLSQIDRVY